MICPCGSKLNYTVCCGRYIDGIKKPETAEELMRSRYTAYTLANTSYIKKTMRGKPALGFNEAEAEIWAKQVTWLNLEVIKAYTENESKSFVEFVASFIDNKKLQAIHEISEFAQEDGSWFYIDGVNPKKTQKKTLARNAPCPCGSEKKFKNCHGRE